MTFDDYLLRMFYLIDTELASLVSTLPGGRVRSHGPEPLLSDSEVVTMELAGEFLGIDTDKGIYAHFRRYHLKEFPALARVCRTTFVRHAANLWRVKQLLQAVAARAAVGARPAAADRRGPAVADCGSSTASPCTRAASPGPRAARSSPARRRSGSTTCSGRRTSGSGGFRVHLRGSDEKDEGPVRQLVLTAADVADLAAAGELAPPGGGVGIGDRNYRNYHGPDRQAELREVNGFVLLAPHRSRKNARRTPTRTAPGCSMCSPGHGGWWRR